MKHAVYILLVILTFSSCYVDEEKRQKCHVMKVGIVEDLITEERAVTTYDEYGYYYAYDEYVVINKKKISYSGDVHPKGTGLAVGDSVWVVSDWSGDLFISTTSDIDKALDSYAKPYNDAMLAVYVIVSLIYLVVCLLVLLFIFSITSQKKYCIIWRTIACIVIIAMLFSGAYWLDKSMLS